MALYQNLYRRKHAEIVETLKTNHKLLCIITAILAVVLVENG